MTILRKVLKAQLHSTIHVKGVGQFGPSIDSSEGKLNGIRDLTLVDNGRGLTLSGKNDKGVPFEALIPDGNVGSMQYDLTPVKPAVKESPANNEAARKTTSPANSGSW